MLYELLTRTKSRATTLVFPLCALASVALFVGCSPEESSSEVDADVDVTTDVAADVNVEVDVATEAAADTSIRSDVAFGDGSILEGLTPKGWHQAGEIEHYNVARLYDKVDGRSELYMAYDVTGLSWISFVEDTDNNTFMDVFLYDMRSPTGAFGVYSVEREIDQPAVDLGREGYRTDSNHYFWKGKYYVYIQASLDTEAVVTAGLGVAKGLADRLADDGSAVEGLDLVPADGLKLDSIQYFKADAMSLDFMTDTFTALYPGGGETSVKAFMSRRPSEADAQNVMDQFVGYLEEYGDDLERKTVDGIEYAAADLGGGFFDAIFRTGNIVAGVTAIEGGAEATIEAAVAIRKKFE